MPTVFTHTVVPLALGIGIGREIISRRLLIAGAILSIIPDLDVLAFRFGIPYSSDFGHRGFSHSLVFAGLCALLVVLVLREFRKRWGLSFAFLFVAMASHGILDTLTNGGLGIELFWPFSKERFFAPVQVITVSPLGVSRVWSHRGFAVLVSEFLWIWLPCAAVGTGLIYYRHRIRNRKVANVPLVDRRS